MLALYMSLLFTSHGSNIIFFSLKYIYNLDWIGDLNPVQTIPFCISGPLISALYDTLIDLVSHCIDIQCSQ